MTSEVPCARVPKFPGFSEPNRVIQLEYLLDTRDRVAGITWHTAFVRYFMSREQRKRWSRVPCTLLYSSVANLDELQCRLSSAEFIRSVSSTKCATEDEKFDNSTVLASYLSEDTEFKIDESTSIRRARLLKGPGGVMFVGHNEATHGADAVCAGRTWNLQVRIDFRAMRLLS